MYFTDNTGIQRGSANGKPLEVGEVGRSQGITPSPYISIVVGREVEVNKAIATWVPITLPPFVGGPGLLPWLISGLPHHSIWLYHPFISCGTILLYLIPLGVSS